MDRERIKDIVSMIREFNIAADNATVEIEAFERDANDAGIDIEASVFINNDRSRELAWRFHADGGWQLIYIGRPSGMQEPLRNTRREIRIEGARHLDDLLEAIHRRVITMRDTIAAAKKRQ